MVDTADEVLAAICAVEGTWGLHCVDPRLRVNIRYVWI